MILRFYEIRRVCLWLVLAGLALSVPGTVYAGGYAVLVGVGRYQEPSVNPLNGPPKDVKKMEDFLRKRYGITNFKILVNDRATKGRILKAMAWLARVPGPEDVAIFYFSGHGSRIPDLDGDEADGLDETIAPYDVSTKPESHISDDEIGLWINRVRSRKLTVILDSCHSGTGFKSFGGAATAKYWANPAIPPTKSLATKAIGGFRHLPRAIRVSSRVNSAVGVQVQVNEPIPPQPPPPARLPVLPAPVQSQWQAAEASVPAPATPPPPPANKPRFTFLAAALSTQFAYDIGAPTDSVFTYYLIEQAQLEQAPTVSTLIQRINQQINNRWPMSPNADGELNASLFFTSASPQEIRLPQTPTSSDRQCNGKFCVSMAFLNKNDQPQNRFCPKEEIRFSVHSTRPAYIHLISLSQYEPPTIIYPDVYHQFLKEAGLNEAVSNRVRKEEWTMIPRDGIRSKAFFEIFGKPSKEAVVLVAFEDKTSSAKMDVELRNLIDKYTKTPSIDEAEKLKQIGTLNKAIGVQLRQNVQSPPNGGRAVRLFLPYWVKNCGQ